MSDQVAEMTWAYDALLRLWRPAQPYSCWRCGCQIPAGVVQPYWLCAPCTDVVSPEEIAWMEAEDTQPDVPTWDMVPLGKRCGQP